jgi:DNA-binding XRE family transcriptional regulator
MSGWVPGTPGSSHGDGSDELVLAAARQEATTLRSILDALQEALAATVARLEALESRIGIVSPANGVPSTPEAPDSTLPARSSTPAEQGSELPAPTRLLRPAAEWKRAPAVPRAGEVVTGDSLRARREALGISQAAVAHAAHCSRGLVAEVERGKRRSAQTLAHLAAVLDRLEQQARRN